MTVKRLAMITVHASPLAALGSAKAGGMNVYVRELAQELGRQGVAVDVFTRRTSGAEAEVDESLGATVRVIRIADGEQKTLNPDSVYPRLSQFIPSLLTFAARQTAPYDMIYSHYWLSGLVAHQWKQMAGIPFAHMFHTLGHMKNRIVPGFLPPLGADERITAELRIVRWADRLIAATAAEQNQLLWLYRADRRKITVVPPGVNISLFHPVSMSEAKARLGLAPDQHLLVFAGRIEPLKAVDTILQALELLLEDRSAQVYGLRLVVIGGDLTASDEQELARLRMLSIDLGLVDRVQFLGSKTQSELCDYYAAALAVLMPSDYESFGMVALEAMASGAPVIASAVGGLAFLVRDGETGFLVPVREPAELSQRIRLLLSAPLMRDQMGQAAASLAQQYTWSVIAWRLLDIFEGILAHTDNH